MASGRKGLVTMSSEAAAAFGLFVLRPAFAIADNYVHGFTIPP